MLLYDTITSGASPSNYLRPHAAIYDLLLTLTCLARVNADAGIDALTHAVESYMVVSYRTQAGSAGPESPYHGSLPLADMLADQAIGLVGHYLRRAVYQGGDLEAREGVHFASMLSGMAFSNAGLNSVRALESHRKAGRAWEDGRFDAEVVPVGAPGRKGTTVQV
jgi:alcohol dehydrogenase class IV